MAYKITGHTRMGCLLGSPVAHSLSPSMYNDSFKELEIDQAYLCYDVGPEGLEVMVQALRMMNVFGFNLTMPHKTAILPLLDELSPAAKLIGAVNTVSNENGRLIGHNTDGIGFMKSVRESGCDVVGKTVTLMGCGGAAHSIAVQAALDGVAKLYIACRKSASWPKAEKLAADICSGTACEAVLIDLNDIASMQKAVDESVLLINGTSVGMAPNIDATPLLEGVKLPASLTVADIIYNPRETRLLREARAQGLKTFNGLYMLLYQGEAAFKIWTGQDMPVELIRERYFR